MRVLLLMLAVLLTFESTRVNTQVAAPCSFAVPGSRPPVTLIGADDLVQRVRLLAQPDSPVAITLLDLTETNLVVGSGAYEKTGRFTLEVMNVSDRPVSGIQAMVHVDHRDGGTGAGPQFKEPLLPGQRARATAGRGRGQGNGNFSSEDVTIQVFIRELSIGDCKYRPSLSIPR